MKLSINFLVATTDCLQEKGQLPPTPDTSASCFPMSCLDYCPQPIQRSKHISLLDCAPILELPSLHRILPTLSVANANSFKTAFIVLPQTWPVIERHQLRDGGHAVLSTCPCCWWFRLHTPEPAPWWSKKRCLLFILPVSQALSPTVRQEPQSWASYIKYERNNSFYA